MAKNEGLLDLSKKLTAPASQYLKINLDKLDEVKGDKIMVVGKILGQGEVSKKIKVSALGFSEGAREKLVKAGCEIKTIKEEIESNKKLEGVEIL